jgi:pimeloyl-ACP methyl ester carboxylesterase
MTIIRIRIVNHLLRYLKQLSCLIFLGLFYSGSIDAAQVSAEYEHLTLPRRTEQVPEVDRGYAMNLQSRLTPARYRASLLSAFEEKTNLSTSVTETYSEDMVCSEDSERPDHEAGLHEEVARTERGPFGYYGFGHGSPLILITGYLSTLSEWNAYFLDELAKQFDVIVFDNRGVGRSATSTSKYRVEDLALDTVALIKALGFRSASVLGWSMGGMIAQRLVLDHPDVVDHLILLNSAPPGHSSIPTSKRVEDVLSGHGGSHFNGVMKILFPAGLVQRAESCFKSDMFKPSDYVPARIPPDVSTAQEAIVQSWALDDRSFAALHHVKAPTLVVGGTDDDVLTLRNSVVLHDAIPQAKLVKVQSGGHAMMYQYPKELARLINTFSSSEQ